MRGRERSTKSMSTKTEEITEEETEAETEDKTEDKTEEETEDKTEAKDAREKAKGETIDPSIKKRKIRDKISKRKPKTDKTAVQTPKRRE